MQEGSLPFNGFQISDALVYMLHDINLVQ